VFIEEDIELNSAPEECNKNKEKNIYKIDRNHTFYDYSVKFARGCNAYNTPADKVKTQEKLQKFIEDNREELLEYVPHIKVRIKTQNIPKYLPTLEYDLSDLKKSLCE
jgi:MinD-like ATPase involved in chromosome partitioning or flagellar assembly